MENYLYVEFIKAEVSFHVHKQRGKKKIRFVLYFPSVSAVEPLPGKQSFSTCSS